MCEAPAAARPNVKTLWIQFPHVTPCMAAAAGLSDTAALRVMRPVHPRFNDIPTSHHSSIPGSAGVPPARCVAMISPNSPTRRRRSQAERDFSICDWGIHWLSLKHDRSSAQPAETDHEGCSPDSGPFCRRACPRSNRKGIPQKRRRRDVATDQSRFKEIRGSLKRPSPHAAPRQTLARHIRLGNCH